MEADPIFLAGADRSGIGLVGELLDAHPNITVTRRLNFWSYYYRRYGSLARAENLERCLADMMRYRRIRNLRPDVERLRRDFSAGDPAYERLFALLLEQHRERIGKRRWCDKSLNAEQYADLVLSAYPTARMVHVIRDPRDRYASEAGHRGRRRGGVGAGVGVWLRSCRFAERNARRFPGRYRVVRYEDLVSGPERCLKEVCGFLGEPFTSSMLMHVGSSETMQERQFCDSSIGRYRRDLSKQDIVWIQAVGGVRMARFGYHPEPTAAGAAERLRIWTLAFPLNTLTLLLWRVRVLFDGIRGRRPSARRLAG